MAGTERAVEVGERPAEARTMHLASSRQTWLVVASFAVVLGTDQAIKWWAWRHLDVTIINSGGYILLGPVIRSWFAHPVSGAVADVVGAVLVIGGVWQLLLRERTRIVLIGGSLIAAGWASNLLDRLGLHKVTGPGSARGVVDMIPTGGSSRCNVADVWIAVGGLLLLYTWAWRHVSGELRGRRKIGPAIRAALGLPGVRTRVVIALLMSAVVALAVTSALNHDGVYSP
jgi:lipoprotein signal peptidase